jgi:glutathione S-transferase
LLVILDKAYGARDFLVGNALTMADLFLAPIIPYLRCFRRARHCLARLPTSLAPTQCIAQRESFKATVPN